ncbi:diacylglycerol kinase [Synergistales bacterium]|nr:diacylglycerol kinase [Synergistales bacterium]
MEAIIKDMRACADALDEKCYAHVSRCPRDAVGVILDYAENADGDDVRVYAVGGDGILYDCLNGVVGLSNAELAAIPYGDANDFVRGFGASAIGVFKDIRLQALSGTVPMDVMRVSGNYAFNYCAVGLEAVIADKSKMVQRFCNACPKFFSTRKPFVYNSTIKLGALLGISDKKVSDIYYDIKVDGEDLSGVYTTLNISNGSCYGGNLTALPKALPFDGELDILFARKSSTIETLYVTYHFVKGRYYKFPSYCTARRGKSVSIRAQHPMAVCVDYEDAFLDTRIDIDIVPGAVRFVVPGGMPYKGGNSGVA